MKVDYSKLRYNAIYNCLLKCHSADRQIEMHLKYVNEDDNSWRTIDDNSEINNNWYIDEVLNEVKDVN